MKNSKKYMAIVGSSLALAMSMAPHQARAVNGVANYCAAGDGTGCVEIDSFGYGLLNVGFFNSAAVATVGSEGPGFPNVPLSVAPADILLNDVTIRGQARGLGATRLGSQKRNIDNLAASWSIPATGVITAPALSGADLVAGTTTTMGNGETNIHYVNDGSGSGVYEIWSFVDAIDPMDTRTGANMTSLNAGTAAAAGAVLVLRLAAQLTPTGDPTELTISGASNAAPTITEFGEPTGGQVAAGTVELDTAALADTVQLTGALRLSMTFCTQDDIDNAVGVCAGQAAVSVVNEDFFVNTTFEDLDFAVTLNSTLSTDPDNLALVIAQKYANVKPTLCGNADSGNDNDTRDADALNHFVCDTSYGAAGTIAGDIVAAAGSAQQPFFTTTVPEPSSIALIGLGMIGMGFATRRRKSTSA